MKKTLLIMFCATVSLAASAQYAGKPWNGTPWSFGVDNSANFKMADKDTIWLDKDFSTKDSAYVYAGVPAWAYDIGVVDLANRAGVSYGVAGNGTSKTGTNTNDMRGARKGTRVLDASDDAARSGASSGLLNIGIPKYCFAVGGAWTRYTCQFEEGKYVLSIRSGNNNNGNFDIWARFLNAPDLTNALPGQKTPTETTDGYFKFNFSGPNDGVQKGLNCTDTLAIWQWKKTPLAPYNSIAFQSPGSNQSMWKEGLDTFKISSGTYVFELSDPGILSSGGVGANGVAGEFTFKYVGPLSVITKLESKTRSTNMFVSNNVLNISGNEGVSTVSVYDISGKQVMNKTINSASVQMPLNLKNGIYVVALEGAAGKLNKKVVIR